MSSGCGVTRDGRSLSPATSTTAGAITNERGAIVFNEG
jgi:hypothetical protein